MMLMILARFLFLGGIKFCVTFYLHFMQSIGE
jgi:hypothetical protein